MAGAQPQPSLDTVRSIIQRRRRGGRRPTLVPVYRQMSSDLLTPSAAYLKLTASRSSSDYSFLFESATTEQVGRWSFVGAGPRKVLTTGPGFGPETDPLPGLEAELAREVVADVPGLQLPPLTGGAIGYVGYDCVRYFEPKTAGPVVKDVLGIPESLFMLFDSIVAFDRYYGVIKVIGYVRVSDDEADLEEAYAKARKAVDDLVDVLEAPGGVETPRQPTVHLGRTAESNVGREGYEAHVRRLKGHIKRGDIFQAVPSQRLSRPTDVHAFNIYRHLRTVNPSPYLFYLDCRDFCIVGASPELLVKTEMETDGLDDEHSPRRPRLVTHPIAGTVLRGSSSAEDARLASELRSSLKDRAEHVMLVDLARNDINRVCDPRTVRVDRLMEVEKFSHVQHLVSQVSGLLRSEKTRFDAFRSVFPAGTVSGAPKVRAMELIATLEGGEEGVYAGAVGYFGYLVEGVDGEVVDGAMDTCIALRTMVVKDGVAYLQAGGGIVFDSDENDEYQETINKLGANMQCIASAEEHYHHLQQRQSADGKQ
ncbi:Anthranilate synthase component 1 [Ophiocordyceps camponoti-floridani]|uniref:Anthranilate synthase component 1 n=1 Tax=Ophiocordyceps camponoti-floridani TaxID=2030778 RepID=A0A8H4Q1M0_9HYPO|nr:Anthranilate synthase component 1 [Ophiocordyceps camponoti-floridani]